MEEKIFIERVAKGDLGTIDVRRYFENLTEIDKADLLQELDIESMAMGFNGYNDQANNIENAIKMLCEVYCWKFDGAKYVPNIQLPEHIQVNKAQEAFAKAIGKGWMKKRSDGGYIWLGTDGKGKKAQLAYLCAKIYGYKYSPNNGNKGNNVPYEDLERLFEVKRLDRAVPQAFEAKKPQLWRETIDEIFQ